MEETLREIKKRFRMAMNGIVSTSMREKGMEYRINFGLTLPLIRDIAKSFALNAEIAEHLWNEQVRESKILATWLYPAQEMTPEKMQQWAEEIPYTEIADMCCMNLFTELPFAMEKASEWIASEKDILRYTGYQLLNRLMIKKIYPDEETTEKLIASVLTYNGQQVATQTAALNCLKRIMHSNPRQAKHIADTFKAIAEKEADDIQKRFAQEILSEYEFCKD